MILSALKVLELNEKYQLIEDLSERELTNPEGVGLDLRVGAVYNLSGDSFLGINKRYSPTQELVKMVSEHNDNNVIMHPGDFYLVTTMETIYSPEEKVEIEDGSPKRHLVPIISPRTSLQRGGLNLLCTKTDPGYRGKLTFGLANVGKQNFKFELGSRMFNIVFHIVLGDIKRAYSGQCRCRLWPSHIFI